MDEDHDRWDYPRPENGRQLVALALAKGYEAFRMGETWQEVQDELDKMQVTPIEADQALLDQYVVACNRWPRMQTPR